MPMQTIRTALRATERILSLENCPQSPHFDIEGYLIKPQSFVELQVQYSLL